MTGPITNKGDKPLDGLHETIIGGTNFKDSKAYDLSMARLNKMGFTDEEAADLLDEKALVSKANPYHDKLGKFTSRDRAGKAPSKEYQQAVKDLKSVGISVASPGSSFDKQVVGAYYGRGHKAGDEGKKLDAMRLMHETVSDMQGRLGINLGKKGITLLTRDPTAALADDTAMAAIGGRAISLGSGLTNKAKISADMQANASYAKEHGHPWGVPEHMAGAKYSEKAAKAYTRAVVRHEIGHLLTTKDSIKKLREWINQSGAKKADLKKVTGAYGASKGTEFLAEAFAKYTDSGYKRGSMPKPVEEIMDGMLAPYRVSKYIGAEDAFPVDDGETDDDWFDGFGEAEGQ